MKELRIGGAPPVGMETLEKVENVRLFVERTFFVPGTHAVFGDLSFFSQQALCAVLKFTEEFRGNLTAYAAWDNVPPVLMSRFDTIQKLTTYNPKEGSFSEFLDGVDDLWGTPKGFLEHAAGRLDSFVLFRSLSHGVRSRVGELL